MKLRKRDRQQKILDEFRISPAVRLGDLADHYMVTKETIRRDIDEMSARGLLARTYGGAVVSFMNQEPGLRERTRLNPEGRRRMAEMAVALVGESSVVMIDTGATMVHLCERLVTTVPKSGDTELTAITNSLRNAAILGANPSIRVVVCPGIYDDRENAVFGAQTIEFIGRFNADVALMSAGGVSDGVVSDANSDAAAIKRAMLRQAARAILLMEHRKLRNPQFERVCALDEIDDLVTDDTAPPEIASQIDGARLHVVSTGS